MEEYLRHLRSFFDEEEEGYRELEEDFLQLMLERLAEGQTEEEIVQNLSDPEEVANDYFRDKSMEVAIHAKTTVVPKEEVDSEFRRSVKRRMRTLAFFLIQQLRRLYSIALVAVLIYFLLYIVLEFVNNQHFATIPFLGGVVIIGLGCMNFQRQLPLSIRTSWMIGGSSLLIGVAGAIFLSVHNELFYQGTEYYNNYVLAENGDISINLTSAADVEFSVVRTGEDEPISLMLTGRFKREDIKKIEGLTAQNDLKLSLDERGIFDVFTKTGKSEILLFVPEGMTIKELVLDIPTGDVRILDTSFERLALDMDHGDAFAKNIIVDEGKILNDTGDVIVENSKANMTVTSKAGKTVFNRNKGNLSIDVDEGNSVLREVEGEKLVLNNHSSKVIIEDSEIGELDSRSTSGQHVIKRSKGEFHICSESGKIVAEQNEGTLDIENHSGVSVIIQPEPIKGSVTSSSGFIKWLQTPNDSMNFVVNSQSGEVKNEFESKQGGKNIVKITSEQGDIKVLNKVD